MIVRVIEQLFRGLNKSPSRWNAALFELFPALLAAATAIKIPIALGGASAALVAILSLSRRKGYHCC
jgi:hypothetical protein